MQEIKRILIVEDDFLVAEKLRGILEDEEHAVVGQTASGTEAIDLTAQLQPDVVLMDLHLLDMDGLTAAREIAARCPTPIVALTAYETPELVAEASEVGLGYYLVKPATRHAIKRAIQIAVARFDDLMKLRRLNARLQAEITERQRTEAALHRIEWMLNKSVTPTESHVEAYAPPYGDVTDLNTCRVILDSVGKTMLKRIAEDTIDLLDTSVAVYEQNGDYAFGMFASGWCQFLDWTSRRLCGDVDNRTALTCGKWLCHENCWHDSAKVALQTGQATDIECVGGIHLYAVPIFAGDRAVGVINIGYGTPPTDKETCAELAERFGVSAEELQTQASAYEPRPPYVIAVAKKRLHTAAKLIGEIVERQRMEKALQKSEQRFRSLFETMMEGVVLHKMVYNEAGRPIEYVILDINPAFQKYMGIDAETARGQRASELYGTGVPPYLSVYAHVVETGEPTTFDVYFAPLHKHFSISAFSPARGQFATVFEDITERKQAAEALEQYAEALKRSNEDLQQFAYTVSHDLQEPLRMVDGFLNLLQEETQGQLSADAEEFIDFAVDGAERMTKLINALLDYARVDTHAQPPIPTDAEVVLKQVLCSLQFNIQEHQAKVTYDPLPTVLVDPTQLGQLFQNLIGNALKFCLDAPPHIHITADRLCTPLASSGPGRGPDVEGEKEECEWRFAVRDNGIGIAPQDLERIFDIFERLHTREEYAGTGLGLAICKKIVERHGGRIWVESEVGHGSTFYFTLPA